MSTYGLVRERHPSENARMTTKAVVHRSCPVGAPAVMDVPFSINCWRIPSVLAHCYYSYGGVSVLVRASRPDQRVLSGGLLMVGSEHFSAAVFFPGGQVQLFPGRLWLHQKVQTGNTDG